MRVLIFDTETTGLPLSFTTPTTDVNNWPHIIQISGILFDAKAQKIIKCMNLLIKPPHDVIISDESTKIHGITKEQTDKGGITIQIALYLLNHIAKDADMIIGHNLSFDIKMVEAEYNRNKSFIQSISNILIKPHTCTMRLLTQVCKIPYKQKNVKVKVNVSSKSTVANYKWPTLSETHNHFFGTIPNGMHNSLVDTLACLRCYIYHINGYDIYGNPQIFEGVEIYDNGDNDNSDSNNTNNDEYISLTKKIITDYLLPAAIPPVLFPFIAID